jgi:hypothetical protein
MVFARQRDRNPKWTCSAGPNSALKVHAARTVSSLRALRAFHGSYRSRIAYGGAIRRKPPWHGSQTTSSNLISQAEALDLSRTHQRPASLPRLRGVWLKRWRPVSSGWSPIRRQETRILVIMTNNRSSCLVPGDCLNSSQGRLPPPYFRMPSAPSCRLSNVRCASREVSVSLMCGRRSNRCARARDPRQLRESAGGGGAGVAGTGCQLWLQFLT